MSDSSFFSQSGSNEATATTINTKVNEAEAAKAAAEAAQAAAEAARDLANASAADAQSSEDDAETAQGASEAARDASVLSASAAAASATSANSYSDDARKLAIEAEDTQYLLSDGTTGYSALHYHEKASDSASAAAVSAGTASTDAGTASTDAATATTKAGEAIASAAAAAASETAAGNSETAAAASETAAAASETAAAASETAAAASETAAAASETNAAGSATTATTQAGTATTKAGEASNSASSAALAQSAAEAARDSALSALDNFQDQYLGSFTSAPTTDLDGDPLASGMLYFNETDDAMKVYDGSQWLNAYASLSGALIANNNLSDLNNAATARTNLGLAAVASSGNWDDIGNTSTVVQTDQANTMADNLSFGDNNKAIFGASSDLQIYHDGSHSYIHEVGTGDLRLKVNDLTVQSTNGSYMMRGVSNGAVSLYYSNFPKLDTTSTGIDVTGNINLGDNNKAIFGAGSDLQIYHTGSTSIISDINNPLDFENTRTRFYNTSSGNSLKMEVTSTGISVSGDITVSGTVDGRDVATDGTKLDGIAANATNVSSLTDLNITDGTNGQALKTDGAGNFSFGDVATSTAWADITSKPTTISGFGITDAFDGAYSSLTGAPTLSAVATSGNYSDLIGTPTIPTNNNQLSNGAGYITSADGGNAATLDGIDSSQFLRSDTNDTMTGQLTISNASPQMKFNDTSGEDDFWIHVNSNNFYVLTDRDDNGSWDGTYPLQLTNATSTISSYGNTVWTSGNDGSGSGLDADLLDGVQGGSYLRSDATDTTTGYFTVDNHFRVVNPSSVTGQGDNATHFNYQDNGTNYIRGALTYVSSPFRIASGGIQRSAHNNGHLEGGYNNIGANSTHTNPIFTIGSSYNPTATALSNMYGIGYTHTNASFIGFAGTSGWGMYVASDGDARVYLSGQTGAGYFTSNVTAYASDERLKTNITTIDNALDKVCQLRGVEYDWVDNITSEYDFHPSSMHETGVLAQNVASVIPDAVCEAPMNANYTAKSGENHEFLTVDKEKIIPVLIEAIKELKQEIEELKKG